MASLSHRFEVRSDGSLLIDAPVPYSSGIWSLKNLEELDPPQVHNGSFNAIGGHGQTNSILLQKTELDWLFSIGDNAKLRSWAEQPSGRIYRSTDNPEEDWWPVILMGSREASYPRNLVKVLEFVNDGTHVMGQAVPAVRLEGIPKSADYSIYTPEKQPWLFGWAWTQFVGGGYGPSHTINGIDYTFIMPYFAPWSGFQTKLGTFDFWVPADCLFKQVS